MAPRKNAASVFMPTKVKRLMQADKEVGKMVAEVPILMACAVEMLLTDLLKSANAIRLQGTTKLLTAAHLEQILTSTPEYACARPQLPNTALHPHEFIAKYSKQSYLVQQQHQTTPQQILLQKIPTHSTASSMANDAVPTVIASTSPNSATPALNKAPVMLIMGPSGTNTAIHAIAGSVSHEKSDEDCDGEAEDEDEQSNEIPDQ